MSSDINYLDRDIRNADEDDGLVNSFLNWFKAKISYIWIPIVTLLVIALLAYFFLYCPFCYVFNKKPQEEECPLKNSTPVTPINEMVKCSTNKPIYCLKVTDQFFQKGNKLQACVQVKSALKQDGHFLGQRLIARKNYVGEGQLINRMHNNLFLLRLASGKTSPNILLHELNELGVDGGEISNILCHLSFVSTKWFTQTDPTSTIFTFKQAPFEKTSESSSISSKSAIGKEDATNINIMSNSFNKDFNFKVFSETFPLNVTHTAEKIFSVEPCSQNRCYHHHSEILILPMELGPHVSNSNSSSSCQCSQCQSARRSQSWLCQIPILGRACSTFPLTKCSFHIRRVSWMMNTCGKVGESRGTAEELKPTSVYMSVLFCH